MLLELCIVSGYEVHQQEKVSRISKGIKLFMVSPECNTFQDMLIFSNILSSPFVYHGRNGSLWVINGINEVVCSSECSNLGWLVDMSSDNLRLVVPLSEGCIDHGSHVLPLLGKQGTADAERVINFTAVH